MKICERCGEEAVYRMVIGSCRLCDECSQLFTTTFSDVKE